MGEKILNIIKESIETKQKLVRCLEDIKNVVGIIIDCYKSNKKVIVFGNGGSAADAQHFAAELVNKFKLDRKPLAAIALTTNSSVLTAIGNDYGYDFVFSKQIEALCNKGDVVIGITTSDASDSGHSVNIMNALRKAKECSAKTVGLFSEKTNNLLQEVDFAIIAPSRNTPRIQEAHGLICHIICELVETELFNKS